MPINISQESYERVKRSPPTALATSKPKKPKLEEAEVKTEEPMETDQVPYNSTHRIMFSLIPAKERKELEGIVT